MSRADELRTAEAEMDSYANAVIAALASDFPDLRDPMIAGIIRKAVYVNARGSSRVGFEVIVDDPFTANWRLVARGGDRRVSGSPAGRSTRPRPTASGCSGSMRSWTGLPPMERGSASDGRPAGCVRQVVLGQPPCP